MTDPALTNPALTNPALTNPALTDPMLADIRAWHLPAATDGQKTMSRRSISAVCVVVVHIVLLFVFWLRPINPTPDMARTPLETFLLLSPANENTPSPPQRKDDREEAKGNSRPQNTAPITIPPPPQPTQEQLDRELMGGLGRALACTAGQFEYLPESARRNCQSVLVPWKLNRDEILARQFKPMDPNAVPLHLDSADANRRTMETYDPCAGSTGPTVSACRTLHPGTP